MMYHNNDHDNISLLFQTDKYTVRSHDMVLTGNTLLPCAVDSWSPSDCLHQLSPLFPFCRHISWFRQFHSSYFMYLIHPFSPWSSFSPPSVSVCQHYSFFQSI